MISDLSCLKTQLLLDYRQAIILNKQAKARVKPNGKTDPLTTMKNRT